ncbi:MAG: hypothetical protein K8I60_22905, partial [Anaerolineae bacterium]|nr:hypothetical protein [Anaerolineae bacterium]
KRAYNLEMDSGVKAQIVRIATSLRSADDTHASAIVAEDILKDALKNPDELVKKAANEIMAHRAAAAARK